MAEYETNEHEIYIGDKVETALRRMGYHDAPDGDVDVELLGNYLRVVVLDG